MISLQKMQNSETSSLKSQSPLSSWALPPWTTAPTLPTLIKQFLCNSRELWRFPLVTFSQQRSLLKTSESTTPRSPKSSHLLTKPGLVDQCTATARTSEIPWPSFSVQSNLQHQLHSNWIASSSSTWTKPPWSQSPLPTFISTDSFLWIMLFNRSLYILFSLFLLSYISLTQTSGNFL